MARGQKAEVGDKRVAPNGYHYTRCEGGWRLTHHIIMEKKLGRTLHDNERVVFVNGKRSDLRPDNLEVRERGTSSLRQRKARIEARIDELQAELNDIEAQLASSTSLA